MSELTRELMKLISKGKSLNEAKEILNLPDKMFLNALKSIRSSYQDYQREFYDNGTVFYLPGRQQLQLPPNKIQLISTQNTFRALFISDLHAGNKNDRLDLLQDVYEYAIKHNISVIINTGDVIENTYSLPPKHLKQKTLEGQINSLIRNYPYSPNIINLILYGNHDYHALIDKNIDVGSIIEQERYDLISLGYGEAFINIKNDEIALQHNIGNTRHTPLPEGPKIIFKGHSHKMKYNLKKGQAVIYVPALSDASPESYEYPHSKGFLDVEMTFKEDDKLDKVYIKQFVIDKRPTIASEFTLALRRKEFNE